MKRPLTLLALAFGLTACGGHATPAVPTIQPAKTFHFEGFQPTGTVQPNSPGTLSFTIVQPDGRALTTYRRGPGPHTGVHLIFVRSDLATLIHHHPPVGSDGRVSDQVTFPAPGTYRLVVDVYPDLPDPQAPRNFQLFASVKVAGTFVPQPVPAQQPNVTVDGYRFQIHGRPKLQAIQAAYLTVTVTDPQRRPARFTPWYGAIAHAIFFHAGSLDYFHTHVCAPGASGCTSVLGASRIAGTSTTPGKLTVGVLLPVSGTWRMFLQCQVDGKVLTAPFTLQVA
jgi:hypothetical protein